MNGCQKKKEGHPGERVLAIIPARGGSKGVPGKNVAMVAGKPLIAWTIEAAIHSTGIHRVIVSTDNEDIAELSRSWGAEVPYLRPPELAQDDTPVIEAVLHVLAWAEQHEGYRPESVILLQPTSPLRRPSDIDSAIQLAEEVNAGTVVSVCRVKHHPHWAMELSPDGRLTSLLRKDMRELESSFFRRQTLGAAYAENGAIYLARRSVIFEQRSFYDHQPYGYVMPEERSLDIDSLWELNLADMLLAGGGRHAT